MKSPENPHKSTPKKPREGKTAIEKKINALLKNADLIIAKTIATLLAYHPEGIEEMKKNITETEKNGNTAIILDTDIGLKMAFGVRKARMDNKSVILATVGMNSDDSKALNILDGVEDELMAMIPEDFREEVMLKMEIAQYEGVEQITLEVIYPGTTFTDLKKKPIAIQITAAPSGMTNNPFVFGLVRGLKNADAPALKVSRNCMTTMDELLGIIDKLQFGQLMKIALKGREEIRSVLDGERSESAN